MQPWDLINPVIATLVARETPDALPDPTLGWLPDVDVQDVRYRRGRSQKTNGTAKFRAWNAESPIGERNFSMTVDEGRFPPISEKLPLDEQDQLDLILADKNGLTVPQAEQLQQLAYDDIRTLARRIRNRMAIARGQVLTTGKFRIDGENGLYGIEADYGLVSGQKPTLGTLWTASANATAIDDERGWITYLQQLAQEPVVEVMTSTRMVMALLSNNGYRQYSNPGANLTYLPNLTGLPALNTLRASLGLPPIVINDKQLTVDGVVRRQIPDNLWLMRTASIGQTQWGITPDAQNLAQAGVLVTSPPRDDQVGAGGLIAGTWRTPDPNTGWTKVGGAGMPIIGDPTGLLIATVGS